MDMEYKTNEVLKKNTVMINGDVVHLKKDLLGWHVIYPWKNSDGSINWFNLLAGGNWWHLSVMILAVIIISLAIFEYTHNINILISCFDNPIALENCKDSFGYKNLIVNP